MANKSVQMFNDWLSQAEDLVKSASVKVAADNEALNGIKDPTDRGQVSIPDCGDGSNRTAQGLPSNANNMGEPSKEHNIMDVTKPNGVGQGQYTVPADGSAADKAVTSPTAPLSKLAASLLEVNNAANAVRGAATATQTKAASPATFELPVSLASDADLMSKLASIGGLMLGSEAGQRAVADVLEKQAGLDEARAIIAEAEAALYKEASQNIHDNTIMDETMIKQATACYNSHAAWLNQFGTDMEKIAYANGAEDGEAIADAVEAGADPSALADVSDEEVLEYLQELVESGQIAPEEAEAVIQALGDAGQDGVTPEEVADAIREAVESGELTPEQGQLIAQQYMEEFQGGAGDEEAAAAEAAAADPAVQAAAAEATEKTAAVVNSLWTPGMA